MAACFVSPLATPHASSDLESVINIRRAGRRPRGETRSIRAWGLKRRPLTLTLSPQGRGEGTKPKTEAKIKDQTRPDQTKTKTKTDSTPTEDLS